jgi:hypothetical protein
VQFKGLKKKIYFSCRHVTLYTVQLKRYEKEQASLKPVLFVLNPVTNLNETSTT